MLPSNPQGDAGGHRDVPYLVGGAISILKNDGVRQWEGLSIHIMENKKCLKPPTKRRTHNLLLLFFCANSYPLDLNL